MGGFYTVLSNNETYVCKARGLFRKSGEVPLPGDDVVFSVDQRGNGYLLQISARKNLLLRPSVANIDMLLIVISAVDPVPDYELVDKLLLYCRHQDIIPVLVVNKCDAGECPASQRARLRYSGAEIEIINVSAQSGFGMDALANLLDGRTICLAGQSAVGKSSLLNSLLGLSLKTGELSHKTDRGRHTTRHAELLQIPTGGLIADTPGFSMLEGISIEPSEIPKLYPEFSNVMGFCRFNGCLHTAEPDCVVKAAVESGQISGERYESYTRIMNEAIEARRNRYD